MSAEGCDAHVACPHSVSDSSVNRDIVTHHLEARLTPFWLGDHEGKKENLIYNIEMFILGCVLPFYCVATTITNTLWTLILLRQCTKCCGRSVYRSTKPIEESKSIGFVFWPPLQSKGGAWASVSTHVRDVISSFSLLRPSVNVYVMATNYGDKPWK